MSEVIRNVIEEYRIVAPTLQGGWTSRMRVPDAHSVDVDYSVETDDDLAAARRIALQGSLDDKTRSRLALNGFLRATGYVVFVHLHSRQAMAEAGAYYYR